MAKIKGDSIFPHKLQNRVPHCHQSSCVISSGQPFVEHGRCPTFGEKFGSNAVRIVWVCQLAQFLEYFFDPKSDTEI
jgi:hypothetical protein